MIQSGLADPRKTFGAAVHEVARYNPDIVVLSADSGGSSGFKEFSLEYPERYHEFGIMEQGVLGIASGLATTGKIPVFCAIAPFVTCRPYEMFRNDVGYMRQNVKVVGRNAGISYSDLGSTHHSLEDFAIIRMIPGVVILAPQDPQEIRSSVKAMIEHDGPVYMRIGNNPIPHLFEEQPFEIGKGMVVHEGSDVTIITTGSVTGNALQARSILKSKGVSARLVAMPTVWPIDRELILDSAAKTRCIVTVEEHYVVGGLGTIVQEICSEASPIPVKKLGIPHIYAASGPYDAVLAHYGLDADGIANDVLKFAEANKKGR
jgi:transketolase